MERYATNPQSSGDFRVSISSAVSITNKKNGASERMSSLAFQKKGLNPMIATSRRVYGSGK